MGRRADLVDETRLRIVEAAVHMHGTVGPAATTIAGIAEAAGVTRVTVYRHFPDDDALFAACSAHWLAGRQPPDPRSWAAVEDPVERLRAGLADLYRFYRAGADMLAHIYHDFAALPEPRQRLIRERDTGIAEALAAAFGDDRRPRAVVGHAVAFATWRSLCLDQGLRDDEAVEAMVAAVSIHR